MSIVLHEFDIWKLLAGLGIFMFGMFLMEESIRKLSGRAFKRMIREYTTGRLKSISSGIFVTAILQSSSAVSLMILAFVGAGIMTMQNAIGVILGSNIGTTITAWIVATVGFKLNIEAFALPLVGIGGLGLIFLGKSEKYSNFSKLLVGFGFLFMGLDYMKVSVEVFTENFDIASLPVYGSVVYLGMGMLLTAVMQSSSATMAIILTALNAGILPFGSAAAMVIGANVGTTVTIMLGAIGAVPVKRRVAFSHLVFNFVTGALALALLPVLSWLVQQVVNIQEDAVIGLALFHTIFNVLGVVVFLPFIGLLARLLNRLLPDRKAELTLFINNTTTDVAEAGISALRKETLHLAHNVLRHNLDVLNIDEKLVFSRFDYQAPTKQIQKDKAMVSYDNLKILQAEIFKFAAGIQEVELSETESEELGRYLHAARMVLHSAKTLKDVHHNFLEFESADNLFLNDQYTHFRKRLIETYLKIESLMDENSGKQKPKAIIKIFKLLEETDQEFVTLTTQAIRGGHLGELDVSTALIVNRAFVQASRQVLLALKELLLTTEETARFEAAEEIAAVITETD